MMSTLLDALHGAQFLGLLCLCLAASAPSQAQDQGAAASLSSGREAAVLLHGLARGKSSMNKMEKHLAGQGYEVHNIQHPSRKRTVEDLAAFVANELDARGVWNADKVHFVTHSMGGIVVRAMFAKEIPGNLGRVVMLCPPNQGSELVDRLGGVPLFKAIYGPAGRQLGAAPDSLPNRLGPVSFELGVLAGDKSLNPVYSAWLEGADDGKVAVARTRVDGMADFMVLPYTHTFFMKKKPVLEQTASFLKNGRFMREEASGPEAGGS